MYQIELVGGILDGLRKSIPQFQEVHKEDHPYDESRIIFRYVRTTIIEDGDGDAAELHMFYLDDMLRKGIRNETTEN